MSFGQDPKIRAMVQGVDEIVDAGWKALVLARRLKQVHLSEKEIFFSGASYLFDAILHAISPDRDPTIEDMQIMEKLHIELEKFNTGFNTKINGAPNR